MEACGVVVAVHQLAGSSVKAVSSGGSSTASFISPFRFTSLNLHVHHSQMLIRSRPTIITTTRRRRVGVICLAPPGAAAELSRDAPFAIAITASMLHSLLFPITPSPLPYDIKLPIMSIISLIPYFNWLSWVFAFTATGHRRYAVYAAVYLAPYLRTNLSLSPDESWLPIASIFLCIIHIQLEASVRCGNRDAFTFLHEAAARFGLVAKIKDNHSTTQHNFSKGRSMKLPASSKSQQREREDHKKPSREEKHGIEDSDLDDKTDHH